ncbi:MAG: N-acetylmuramoyl-L-alanine amidase [Polyangiaceae bacterium]
MPSASACARGLSSRLKELVAFRPEDHVLRAIDADLARDGVVDPKARVAARGTASPSAPGASAAPGDSAPTAPHVERIESWPGAKASRIVVVLSAPATYRVEEGAGAGDGAVVNLELDGVSLPSGKGTIDDVALRGMVKKVHTEASPTGTRVTMSLAGNGYRRAFHLLEPYRVVVDVASRAPKPEKARGKRVVERVVLDPGHGGFDPGAVGSSGLKEKDVTLDVAKLVAPVLAKEGIVVAMTRDDDRAVTLEARTARANEFNADLFISIHCNSSEDRRIHGVETYVLDTTKDDIAARVESRENATSRAASAEIGSLLASMRLADQATRSTKFAHLLQRAAVTSLRMDHSGVSDGGVKTAGFYVLVGARMPSALFEVSYLSNPEEEMRLLSADYRTRLADGIVNAVRAWRDGR